MEIRYGSAIVKQIALGPLSFYHRPCPQVTEHSLLTPEEELIRFSRAQQTALDRLESLREQAEASGIRVEIADRALERISKKENCFAAMVYKKQEGVFDAAAPHIVLVNPSDSGNLGTILRTALGFGLVNIAIIRPAVDSDDPRVTRASMGAAFSLNVRHFDSFNDYRNEFPERQLFPFMLTGAVPLAEAVKQVNGPFSLVFGNEATGLPDVFAEYGISTLIPHSGKIDSLNLAIAAGIGMYAFTNRQEA